MNFDRSKLEQSIQWPAVQAISEKLIQNGFRAYLAGGCVRDSLLGQTPHDLDLVTEASVDQLKSLFEKVVLVGEAFGVIRIVLENSEVEVAQFRKESDYKDGRRPSLVSSATPEQDAQRRDLTINALFFDLKKNQLLDYVHGLEDLNKGLIRFVGDAEKRLSEDHLRGLRAIRFKNKLGFEYEHHTSEALSQKILETVNLSRERVQDELLKTLRGDHADRAMNDYENFKVISVLFPEREINWIEQKEFIQKKLIHNQSSGFSLNDSELLLLFFWKAAPVDKILEGLRLSRNQSLQIRKALDVSLEPQSFFQKKKFDQWSLIRNPLVRKSLEWLDLEPAQKILQSYQDRGLESSWPLPLIQSKDLIAEFQGARLGQKLDQAYRWQIEENVTSKESLLEILRKGK